MHLGSRPSGRWGSVPARVPYASVAQLVEHSPEKWGVVGAIPTRGTIVFFWGMTPGGAGTCIWNKQHPTPTLGSSDGSNQTVFTRIWFDSRSPNHFSTPIYLHSDLFTGIRDVGPTSFQTKNPALHLATCEGCIQRVLTSRGSTPQSPAFNNQTLRRYNDSTETHGCFPNSRDCSSTVEHPAFNRLAEGSNPSGPTNTS